MHNLSEFVLICHSTDQNKINQKIKFQFYLEKLEELLKIDTKYYYIIFAMFEDFITPSSQEEFIAKAIPKLRKNSRRNLKKIFGTSYEEMEDVHQKFYCILHELFDLNYESFKSFRGYYLEYIIHKFGKKIIGPIQDDKFYHAFVEPEIKLNNEKILSEYENDMDVGLTIQNSLTDLENTDKIYLLECKSSINSFTKSVVYFIEGNGGAKINYNKVVYMKEIHAYLNQYFSNFKLFFATYESEASIYYKTIAEEGRHYLITFLQENVELIGFTRLLKICDYEIA